MDKRSAQELAEAFVGWGCAICLFAGLLLMMLGKDSGGVVFGFGLGILTKTLLPAIFARLMRGG